MWFIICVILLVGMVGNALEALVYWLTDLYKKYSR
jgi:hypothetical protein